MPISKKTKTTAKQFVFSALLGLIAATGYLVTAYYLDKVMNYNAANIIGLVVDHIINFFLQFGLFVKADKKSRWDFFWRFTIGNFITIAFSQALFMSVHAWVKKYKPDFYAHGWKKHVTLIRYLLGAVTYVFVSFPLRKYYIFKHDESDVV